MPSERRRRVPASAPPSRGPTGTDAYRRAAPQPTPPRRGPAAAPGAGGQAGRGGGRGSHNSCRAPQSRREAASARTESPRAHRPRVTAAPPSGETWRQTLGPAATSRPPRQALESPPPTATPWLARLPALLGPGPLLPSRLLTALRRIPVGGCAAILSELQSQDRPRPQPDWEARSPPRASTPRPLPGRSRRHQATPTHFRLGQRRICILGRDLPERA